MSHDSHKRSQSPQTDIAWPPRSRHVSQSPVTHDWSAPMLSAIDMTSPDTAPDRFRGPALSAAPKIENDISPRVPPPPTVAEPPRTVFESSLAFGEWPFDSKANPSTPYKLTSLLVEHQPPSTDAGDKWTDGVLPGTSGWLPIRWRMITAVAIGIGVLCGTTAAYWWPSSTKHVDRPGDHEPSASQTATKDASGISASDTPPAPILEVDLQVVIPGGQAIVGASKDNRREARRLCRAERGKRRCSSAWFEDEQPRRRVDLNPFRIDRFLVSHADYQSCLETGHCKPIDTASCKIVGKRLDPTLLTHDHPVVCATWPQAQAYCMWRGKRLPTEWQWERAARGSDGSIFPWGDEWDPSRAFDGRSKKTTSPVTEPFYGVPPEVAQQMGGNVWEWTADWYKPGFSSLRVRKGSAWSSPAAFLRGSNRAGSDPRKGYSYIGFRCVASETADREDASPVPKSTR